MIFLQLFFYLIYYFSIIFNKIKHSKLSFLTKLLGFIFQIKFDNNKKRK